MQNLSIEEKNELEKLAFRFNHIAVGSGIIGLLVFSLVDYFITPRLWLIFLGIRLLLMGWGIFWLLLNFFQKKSSQLVLYIFWVPILVFTSYAVSQLDNQLSLLTWNLHLCLATLFLYTVSLTYFPLVLALIIPTIISYLGFCLLFSPMSWADILVNGGALYLIGNLIAAFIVIARFRMYLQNIRLRLSNEKQKEQLEALNKVKDRFFTVIAHDLRGPLSSASRLIERVLREESKDLTTDIELIGSSLNQLNKLLENLLLWAKAQKGELKPSLSPIDVRSIINLTLENLKPLIQKKQLSLKLELTPDLKVLADKEMLATVLRNILSNSLKYSFRKGQITIKSLLAKDQVLISVSDEGIGIEQKKLMSLFSIEHKHSSLGTDGEAGSGLGLIISRELTEELGGSLWVESKEGSGTTAYLELPAFGEKEGL